jgi:DNA (cytosine-5)-methyltransferase 1
MQEQSSESTGPTCDDTTTCGRSHRHTHTHTQDFSVDLICGGFPCQDISVAGKGAGLAGARSGLWHDFARIIRTVQPRWVVIENVPALTARGLGTVLGDLAEIGFDSEWHCIPASAVGAPHRRERIWIVGNAQRNRRAARRNNYGRHDRRQPHANGQHAAQVADTKCKRREADGDCLQHSCQVFADANGSGRKQQRRTEPVREEQPAIERSGWWESEPEVGRVAHGIPSRVDRLRCLGNAVVPQVVEVIGRAILDAEARMNA